MNLEDTIKGFKGICAGEYDHLPEAAFYMIVTIEAVRPLFDKELTAFGPLFYHLSLQEIDSAALLSRATAGVVKKTILFCMPGSLKACKLACKALIFPELGHLVKHAHEG